MKVVYDLEATGLVDHTALEYGSYPLKLKDSFKIHCIVFKDIDTGDVTSLYEKTLTKERVEAILKQATTLIAHNQIAYDLLVLHLYFGIDFHIAANEFEKSSVAGSDCEIVDTVILSRMMWPDRPSGHSLKEWGKRLDVLKGDYGNQESAWGKFSLEMLDYCKQDVEVNESVYYALLDEMGDWDWNKAFQMEQAIAEITVRQEHFGYYFNKEKAEEALSDLNTKMADIEAKVEPLLPEKPLSKTNARKFEPPKIQFKKDGSLSANMIKFVDRMGGKLIEDEYGEVKMELGGVDYDLPLPIEPLVTTEPMKLANQADLKQYLVRLGWRPTVWGENDLSVDSKKRPQTDEKYKAAVVRYCEETMQSDFKKFRLLHRKCKTVRELYDNLMSANKGRPIKVITAPKYTVDQDKTICPNLTKLGHKVEFVEDVVYWLTYRHRRNSILSPKGTGFLGQPRIDIDNRIQTPAITCGAASSRYRHAVTVNIPRPTSVYGGELRELFGAAPGTFQIGCDAAGLEARVEAHYTKPYPEGEEYSVALLSEKPNDIHTTNSRKMNVSRDEAKTLKYASSYGAQPPKIAKQMGWSLSKAQKVFDDFWDAALPLKLLKEKLTQYWKTKGGKEFIKAIDGRKLHVRSEHSLVNLLFQSCGVIIMKYAAVILDRWLQERGYLFNPFKDNNFTGKAAQMIHYHDEYQLQVCPTLVDYILVDSENEVNQYTPEGNKRASDPTHIEDKFLKGYSPVGEKMSLSIKEAAEYYELRVPFDGDYQIGFNWRHCH